MSIDFKKPDASELIKMMNMILGDDSNAVISDEFNADSANFTAVYVNDLGDRVATCRLALPTAAALGCALSMIPPGAAEAMVEDNELTQTATENLYEVMNIFSSLLMDDKSSHLKLVEVTAANDASMEGSACEFTIELGKYGKGHLLFNLA